MHDRAHRSEGSTAYLDWRRCSATRWFTAPCSDTTAEQHLRKLSRDASWSDGFASGLESISTYGTHPSGSPGAALGERGLSTERPGHSKLSLARSQSRSKMFSGSLRKAVGIVARSKPGIGRVRVGSGRREVVSFYKREFSGWECEVPRQPWNNWPVKPASTG